MVITQIGDRERCWESLDGFQSLFASAVIKGYYRRVAEDPHGELKVSPQEFRVFLSAMKEEREAASFGAQPDAAKAGDEAAARIARHREDGILLADILDEIASAAKDEAPTDETPT